MRVLGILVEIVGAALVVGGLYLLAPWVALVGAGLLLLICGAGLGDKK